MARMRTLLSQFCDEFESVVRPTLDPLQRAAAALTSAPPTLPARGVLPQLQELRHQLQALTEKVAGQQAYVLIFGPLKSGKSTLMNAMSAAYVSEVTCLPAYPCMVYVAHGDQRRYEVESYDGARRTYTDAGALRREIGDAHAELARQMRAHPEPTRGEPTAGEPAPGDEFDPGAHWPKAIRRVDVRVPAGSLERSGAVLVDTPGLYSRMKFGYDRMTRDFRDAAACAVFVVKTDNLFLEQVFDEFVELLELFSRIFLVVNLDSTKQDLAPDGTLRPSLEHEAPGRVIEAFENLTMSAPLKRAVDEGRLGIYPVDLLQAASRRLRGQNGDRAFDTFTSDLTEYLNSSDYLVAFLGDSLRRARTLFAEMAAATRSPEVERLERELGEVRAGLALTGTQAETLARLEGFDWTGRLRVLADELAERSRQPADRTHAEVAGAVAEATARWFEGDESLRRLFEGTLEELFVGSRRELAEAIRTLLGERVRLGSAGLVVDDGVIRDLDAAGLSLDRIGRGAVADLRPDPGEPGARLAVRVDELPVKRGWLDWLLLRTRARLQRKLFGEPDQHDRPIPAAVKVKRLGEPAREALQGQIESYLRATYARDVERVSERLFADYSDAVGHGLAGELARKRRANDQRRQEYAARLETLERVESALADLGLVASTAGDQLAALDERYGRTESELLIQPAPPPRAGAEERTEPRREGERTS